MSFGPVTNLMSLIFIFSPHANAAKCSAAAISQCQAVHDSAIHHCDGNGAIANKMNNTDAVAAQKKFSSDDSTPDYSGALSDLTSTAAGRLNSAKQFCEDQKKACQDNCQKCDENQKIESDCEKQIAKTEGLLGSGANGNTAASPQAKDTQNASTGKDGSGGGGMPQMPQMPQQDKKDQPPQTPQPTASTPTPAAPSNCSASTAFSGGSAPGCAESIATKCAGQFAGTNSACANYGQFQAQAQKICNAGQGSAALCQSINTQSVCSDMAKSGQALPEACNGGSAVSEGPGRPSGSNTAAQSLNFGSASGGGMSGGALTGAAAASKVAIHPESATASRGIGSLATEGGGGGSSSPGGSLPDLSNFSFGANARGPASAKKSSDGELTAMSVGAAKTPVIPVPALSNIVAEIYHKKCVNKEFLHCEGVK